MKEFGDRIDELVYGTSYDQDTIKDILKKEYPEMTKLIEWIVL